MREIKFNKNVIKGKNLIQWNNKVSLYIDRSTIPSEITDLSQLNGKGVVYYIVTENNKLYIGSTNDFGQRIQTHIKCSRSDVATKNLYYDIKKYGKAIVGILSVHTTKEQAKDKESRSIIDYKSDFLNEMYGKTLPLVPIPEREKYLFNHKIYNVIN